MRTDGAGAGRPGAPVFTGRAPRGIMRGRFFIRGPKAMFRPIGLAAAGLASALFAAGPVTAEVVTEPFGIDRYALDQMRV